MKLKNLFKRKKKSVVKKTLKKISPKKSSSKKISKKAPKKTVNKRKTSTKKEKVIEINRNECPECGSQNVVISQITGNTICQNCGAILAGGLIKEE